MKLAVKLIFLGLVIAGGWYLWLRIPRVKSEKACLEMAKRVYDHKASLVLPDKSGTDEVCERHQRQALAALKCWRELPPVVYFTPKEEVYLEQVARALAKFGKSWSELALEHNQNCTKVKYRIWYEPEAEDPFLANFR